MGFYISVWPILLLPEIYQVISPGRWCIFLLPYLGTIDFQTMISPVDIPIISAIDDSINITFLGYMYCITVILQILYYIVHKQMGSQSS